VQLYIRDEVSPVTRPIEELREFHRISLDPGQTQNVEFKSGFDELSFLNRDVKRVVGPGTIKVMIGSNSVNLQEVTLNIVAKKALLG
jgi:beta-glucosidase